MGLSAENEHVVEVFQTYRTIVERCPTDCNSWKAGGLWTRGLHVAHTISRTAIIHIDCRTWWIGSWKTATCIGSCMGRCWRSKALCRRRCCLIIIHHCKGNREVGLWSGLIGSSWWLSPACTRWPYMRTQ